MKLGIHIVPEDRAKNAIVKAFTVRQNMTLPFLRRLFSNFAGFVMGRREEKETQRMIRALEIKCTGDRQPIEDLSGGNQQKVVWPGGSSPIVGYSASMNLSRASTSSREKTYSTSYPRECGESSVVIISSDIDEVIDVADRIAVINNGMIIGEQESGNIDRGLLLRWIAQDPQKG